jgi:rSAM/selenodomain-associated transferase 1
MDAGLDASGGCAEGRAANEHWRGVVNYAGGAVARADRGAARSPRGSQVSSCGIAVMAKASIARRTKTRLVPALDYEQAAAFNTAFLKDVAGNLLDAAQHRSIVGYMAFGPPGSEAFFREILPPQIERFESWLPAFGGCLLAAVVELFKRGHRGAIVLNSDSPTLPTSLVLEAADVLSQPGDRAVLGPAIDGGYYLLGLKHAHRRMFEDIEWSTSRVAAQTIERAGELGLDVHMLAPWYDVDDSHSLRILHGELIGGRPFDEALSPYRASHTLKLLRSMRWSADQGHRLGVPPVLEGSVS